MDPDPPLPTIVTAAEAMEAGLTRSQIAHRVRCGRWAVLAPGVFAPVRDVASGIDVFAQDRVEHARRAVAAAIRHPGYVIAGHSAAAIQGLPLATRLPPTVSLIARPGGWTGRRPGVVLHRAELAPTDVRFRRVPFTSAARTCFDVACRRGLADGLAVGDAALSAGVMSIDELERIVAAASGHRGVRQARLTAAHVSSLRESPLESASWAYFVRHDVPLPRMQVEVADERGGFVARVDVLWERPGVVGECDGRGKYTGPGDLYREKVREDRLRALGFRVVRWGWRDLQGPDLAARLTRLIAHS